MSLHQYEIYALVFQTSFRGETNGGVAKCRLFSQASKSYALVEFHHLAVVISFPSLQFSKEKVLEKNAAPAVAHLVSVSKERLCQRIQPHSCPVRKCSFRAFKLQRLDAIQPSIFIHVNSEKSCCIQTEY